MKHKLVSLAKTSAGNNRGAVETTLESQATNISVATLLTELKQCSNTKDLQAGKLLHTNATEAGFHKRACVATALISMYTKCGSVQDARDVFENMVQRDVVCWTALILGYVENGENSQALDVFNSMDCAPDGFTFVAALKACAGLASKSDKKSCLQKGLVIHRQAIECAFEDDVYVTNTLVDMYSKCGFMFRARDVFDGMKRRQVISWNALILGYVENGESLLALDVFNGMDCTPNSITFLAAIKACASLASDNVLDKKSCLQKGVRIHREAGERGFDKKVFVANTLVDMYSKCKDMVSARKVFDGMLQRGVVSWNVLILGYVENGESLVGLSLFGSMDCKPDSVTFLAALKACAGLASDGLMDKESCLQKGMNIHRQARECGFHRDLFVESTLIDMYSKCGNMVQARDVFESMMHRTTVSWNALLLGYVENGVCSVALDVFNSMDCAPNRVTFVAALKACAGLTMDIKFNKNTCLRKGMAIHRQARDSGFEKDIFVCNTLVDMYTKCGSMTHARNVFDGMMQRDVVSWNVLILGYVENGESLLALEMFKCMDCAPDGFTFVAALKACTGLSKEACLQEGVRVHRQARECGFDGDPFVASTLVDMYSKCGDMLRAKEVFESMLNKSVVSWNTLILGYVENGEGWVALDLFNTMDCAPNSVTYVVALKACASVGALETGQRIHDRVCELGLEQDETIASCLVDFYGKCGYMALAEEMFNRMHFQDTVSWTALIAGYSVLGNTSRVFDLVKEMQEADLQMDGVTVMLVLTACSHAGKVQEGQEFFKSMSRYGVNPTVEHYTCMVDLLGRANRLQEALLLIRSMPMEAKSCIWMTLLGACRKWSSVEIGEIAFRELMAEDDKEDVAAAFVLMRNIYEKLGMQQEGENMEAERKKRSNSCL